MMMFLYFLLFLTYTSVWGAGAAGGGGAAGHDHATEEIESFTEEKTAERPRAARARAEQRPPADPASAAHKSPERKSIKDNIPHQTPEKARNGFSSTRKSQEKDTGRSPERPADGSLITSPRNLFDTLSGATPPLTPEIWEAAIVESDGLPTAMKAHLNRHRDESIDPNLPCEHLFLPHYIQETKEIFG
ncbi:hypothetical protein EBQ93_03200, partial [bacterium]|nr:hypothetical protein [bacterium]